MPQVDLSTLGGPELRQLLDSARRRGQASLSYQILQEMEARRSRGAPRRPIMPGHRAAEPKMVAYEFGDPLEHRDEPDPLPAWEPPPEPEPELKAEAAPEPEPQAEAEPPLRLEREPSATKGRRKRKTSGAAAPLASEPAPPPPPVVQRQRGRVPVLGFSLGIALGAALGWWVAKGAPFELSPRAIAPSTALAANTATAAPLPEATRLPPVNALPAPIPEAASTATAAPPPAAEAETPASAAPEPTDVAQEAPAPTPAKTTAKAAQEDSEAAAPPPPAAKGCAAQATPADRTICGNPNLQKLQRELRQAYAEALEAHEDRALLREHQLAWRDARDGISDPQRLTRLYEARIRKLEAATADARRHR